MRHFVPGILVALALAGCGEAPVVSAPAPILPSAPAYIGCPVKVRPPTVGEDARVLAARERVGRLTANRCFRDATAFYSDVEAKFGAPSR